MPKDFSRVRRVAELVQRELAQLLETEVSDPRLALVTVTSVEMSRDLRHAVVYVTCMRRPELGAEREDVLRALTRAGGFLRRQLSHNLTLKTVPDLQFRYDTSIERGIALSKLIDQATRGG